MICCWTWELLIRRVDRVFFFFFFRGKEETKWVLKLKGNVQSRESEVGFDHCQLIKLIEV